MQRSFSFMLALPITLAFVTPALANESLSLELSVENAEPVNFANTIRKQIQAKEFEVAINAAENQIRNVERRESRYDLDLTVPLVLLGDALTEFGDYDGALQAYDRAIHVTRVNLGLHDPKQVDIVYREAATMFARGELNRANDRQEYAYNVLLRNFNVLDPLMLPGIFRLAEWYTQTYNIFSARSLYELAGDLAIKHYGLGHPEVIRAYKGEAMTYRLERFRPSEMPSRQDTTLSRSAGPPQDPIRQPRTSINNFAPGERALLDVVNMLRTNPLSTKQDIAVAMLDLADWYLLFGQDSRAYTLYEDVWRQLETSDQGLLDQELRYGKPIFLPLPNNPKPPPENLRGAPLEGIVELSLSINQKGKITNIETLRTEPRGMMETKIKREIKRARYRPAFEKGKARSLNDVRLEHRFTYFPRIAGNSGGRNTNN